MNLMKRIFFLIVGLLTILLMYSVFISCNPNRNSNKNTQSKTEEAFDSTYYFILKDAFAARDTALRNAFFDRWSDFSLKLEMKNENEIAKILNDIFIAIYHPSDLEKYHWFAWWGESYRYTILPSEIQYKIMDSDSLPTESSYIEDLDTLKGFYPNPNFEYTKKLIDTNPFKKSMELFLEEDSREKMEFLSSYDNFRVPISIDRKSYQAKPNIVFILLNKNLNKAVAYLQVEQSGVSVELSLIGNHWKIEKANTLWIE